MVRMQDVFNTLNERLDSIERKLDAHGKHPTTIIRRRDSEKGEGVGEGKDAPQSEQKTSATAHHEAPPTESEIPKTSL